jgi:aspartyl-tRNA(Asn)/glutamyl-tRNA(Gln) amidotransferase subunit C
MPLVTHEEVQRIARLARLTLTAQETEALIEHFTKVLTYVETLNTLPTDAIEPFTHDWPYATARRPRHQRPR